MTQLCTGISRTTPNAALPQGRIVNDSDPKPLVARLRQFFGQLPGQGFAQFAAEIKALTPADREYFVAEFNKAGMPTILSAPNAAAA
jgi:hypothetical protein